MKGYWHINCPVCEQGRLFVMAIADRDQLFLLCEECEAAWTHPDKVIAKENFDPTGLKISIATLAEVERHAWHRYQLAYSDR